MPMKILTNTYTQYFLMISLVAGALLCIFPPQTFFFRSMAEFAVQILFGYLGLGLLFLVLNQPKLMFTSFIACSTLAIHIKLNTNTDLKKPLPTENQTIIEIALINVSNINEDPDGAIQAMLTSKACILSISDIDPMVYEFLRDTLAKKFPYCTNRIGFDPGIAVFSKFEINNQDTFFVESLPNIMGSIKPDGQDQELFFISSTTLPPFYTKDYDRLKKQLNRIAEKVSAINAPILTLADYNLVQWSHEIHDFRNKAGLKDSRRGFYPPAAGNNVFGSFFESPRDHIFFSEHFKCIGFENLESSSSQYLGIKGSFQFNPISSPSTANVAQ
jgi:hypothetical protein